MMSKKDDKLKGHYLRPFYILKVGDLVRVKDWDMYYPGQIGIIISKSEYGVASDVVLSSGQKRTLMNFVLERVNEED
jgi:hypothetical protein